MRISQQTASYYLSSLTVGLFSALIGPSLPYLAENTSSALNEISQIFILLSLGYLLGSFLGGRAFDHLPGHQILGITFLFISICGAIIPLMPQLASLLAVMFILGLFQGVNDVGCNTLLLLRFGNRSGAYINGLHFFFGLGATISPLVLAGLLSSAADTKWAFWLFALLCLPLAIWFWRLPDEVAGFQEPVTGKSSSPGLLPVFLLFLAFIFYTGAEVGFSSWVYTYALTLGLGTAVTSATLTSAFWGSFTLGRLLGIWISTRVRRQVIILVNLGGILLSLSLLLAWPGSHLVLWGSIISTGLFMASSYPTMLLLAEESLEISGALTGWLLVGGGLGSMIIPWLIGVVFTGHGPASMPVIILGAITLSLISITIFRTRILTRESL